MKNKFKILISVTALTFLIAPLCVFAYGLATYNATDITDTSATLNGYFNIAKNDKKVPTWFEWADYQFNNNDTRTASEEVPNDNGDFSYTYNGFRPNTTYYYRACFKRSGNNCQQNYLISFTTWSSPTVPSVSIGTPDIQARSATLVGTFTANRRDTTAWFEYGDSESLGSITFQKTAGPQETKSMSMVIRGLQSNTPYYYRMVAQNSVGTSVSPIYSFTTSSTSLLQYKSLYTPQDNSDAALSISTKGVSGLGDTFATLLGSGTPSAVNPTTVYFRYSTQPIPPVFCNELYGNNMISTSDISLGIGGGGKTFSQNISDLLPDTTYYYCAIASTKKNIAYGNNQTAFSFTTLPCQTCDQATIKTEKATNITSNSANLNAFYNSTGSVKVWFEYMLAPSNNSSLTNSPAEKNKVEPSPKKTPEVSYPAGNGPVAVKITGLQNGKTHQYWAKIRGTNGKEIKGNTFTFKVGSPGNKVDCDKASAPNLYALEVGDYLSTISKVSTPSGSGIPASSWANGFQPVGIPNIGNPSAQGTSTNSTPSLIDMSKAQKLNLSNLFEGLPVAPASPLSVLPQANTPVIVSEPISFLSAINLSSNPCDPITPVKPVNPTNSEPNKNTGQTYKVGETATPPIDATVHQSEGIETVLARQIVGNTELAKTFGYDEGTNLQAFAWSLADLLARNFGYINSSGKEIRVSKPDIAAYQLQLEGRILTIYEYYNSRIVNIQKMSTSLRGKYYYEYYYKK